MYRNYYGLQHNPFDLTPDPRYFFATPSHNEVLANLFYGVQSRKGFVMVTGEVGTGKTLLLRCLLDLLAHIRVESAYIFNPLLSPQEFLQQIACDLRLPAAGRNKSELLTALQNCLIDRHRRGSTTVLIIDEAHLLSWELLEEVRLLGNLETREQKLLQVILMGQPEFSAMLDTAPLRQLKQRIELRCALEPLGREQVRQYIHQRLALAAGRAANELFPEETIELIYSYSRGVPRTINIICENALISGCARQVGIIDTGIIEEVAADFHLSCPEEPERKQFRRRSSNREEVLGEETGHFTDTRSLEGQPQ